MNVLRFLRRWLLLILLGLGSGTPSRASDPGAVGSVNGAAVTEVPDQIVVIPRAGVDPRSLMSIIAIRGARTRGALHERERCLSRLGLLVVDVPVAKRQALVTLLRTRVDVDQVSPVYVYTPALVPSDPSYSLQYPHPLIGDPSAWDLQTGTVTIAVCDTGVDPTHADLAARLVPGYNFWDDNTDTRDVYGHGTAVAGTAAAIGNNGVGVAGVAWTSPIMPLRISNSSGQAYSTDIAAAIQYAADHGARVINVSFGPLQGDSTVAQASKYAAGRSSLVVIAAGNSGSRNSFGATADQLFVAATDSSDLRASFSTYGPSVGIAAPGVGVLTCYNGGGYAYYSGTSFSAPIVSGVAALCMSARPTLTAYDVKTLLQNTAQDLGVAGYDEFYGYGRVDAARAVSTAASTIADTQPPVVALTSPLEGTVITRVKLLTIRATATDNIGVANVRLFIDGVQQGPTLTGPPFEWTWNCGSGKVLRGTHSLQTFARDAAGNSGSSAIIHVKK